MKWSFFVGACVLATMLLLAYGAPLPAVVAGIALAAVLNWRKRRASSQPPANSSPPE